jgi:hypothetical protein
LDSEEVAMAYVLDDDYLEVRTASVIAELRKAAVMVDELGETPSKQASATPRSQSVKRAKQCIGR